MSIGHQNLSPKATQKPEELAHHMQIFRAGVDRCNQVPERPGQNPALRDKETAVGQERQRPFLHKVEGLLPGYFETLLPPPPAGKPTLRGQVGVDYLGEHYLGEGLSV